MECRVLLLVVLALAVGIHGQARSTASPDCLLCSPAPCSARCEVCETPIPEAPRVGGVPAGTPDLTELVQALDAGRTPEALIAARLLRWHDAKTAGPVLTGLLLEPDRAYRGPDHTVRTGHDHSLWQEAARSLVSFDTQATPHVVPLLDSPDVEVRRRASGVFSWMRTGGGAEACGPVTRLLGDPDPAVRHSAILAFEAQGKLAQAAVPELLRSLQRARSGGKERRSLTVVPIAKALASISQPEEPIFSALEAVVLDDELYASERIQTLECLLRLAETSTGQFRTRLVEVSWILLGREENPQLIDAAASMLAWTEPGLAHARRVLELSNPRARQKVALRLCEHPMLDLARDRALVQAVLSDPSADVRAHAIGGIGERLLRSDPEPAFALIMEALQRDSSASAKNAALRSLRNALHVGRRHRDQYLSRCGVAVGLARALDDSDQSVRVTALSVIGALARSERRELPSMDRAAALEWCREAMSRSQ